MTRTRWTALAWILLSCGLSILWGFSLESALPIGMIDFKPLYYGERCLFLHHDPYRLGEPLRVYQAAGGVLPQSRDGLIQNLTWYIYPPTASLLIAPIAMLPWGPAHVLWVALTAGVFILAALLMWNLGASYASRVSLLLMCILLASCEIIFATGNAAGIAVSLCVVAVWCFLRERFVWAGILCLAVSLAIKPHDAGLIWLYFLLAGAPYRKRALQTLLVVVLLVVPACLWVSSIAPHWMGELHSNLLAAEALGGNSNPGPANPVFISCPEMIIDLQSTISAFRDDPRIYNPISYLVCGALLVIWSIHTLRVRFSPQRAWLALAAIVPLTLLVTYHRPYDAKLLLLTVPACALLWAEGRPIRWLALVVSAAAIVFTADLPLTILLILIRTLHITAVGLPGELLTGVLMRPTPLILLAMSIFYLWIYVRRDSLRDATAGYGEPEETPITLTPGWQRIMQAWHGRR
jgi:hypothetical protein